MHTSSNTITSIFKEITGTFIYPAKTSEIHLIRAVEDNNILSQGFAHIFGGLCLPSSCTVKVYFNNAIKSSTEP